MRLALDYETRSRADLRAIGGAAYHAHGSTQVTVATWWREDEARPRIWHRWQGSLSVPLPGGCDPGTLADLQAAFDAAAEVWAFNAAFEVGATFGPLAREFGVRGPGLERWRCTMALALSHGITGALDDVAAALALAQRKDKAGAGYMRATSRPVLDAEGRSRWVETPETVAGLLRYALPDVLTECAIRAALLPMRPEDWADWAINERINWRGFRLDRNFMHLAEAAAAAFKADAHAAVREVTQGRVQSADQAGALADWLRERGYAVPDLKAETVESALEAAEHAGDGDAARVLEARQAGARASLSKLSRALGAASGADDRIRGTLQYWGAHTGRYAGRIMQPHNLPRVDAESAAALEPIFQAATALAGDGREFADRVRAAARGVGVTPADLLTRALRGCIVAAPGCALVWADFANIEGRVLAWLSGEAWKVDAFAGGRDLYIEAAARMFGLGPKALGKGSPERQTGKVAELSLGYQGGRAALQRFGASMGVDWKSAGAQLDRAELADLWSRLTWQEAQAAERESRAPRTVTAVDAITESIKRAWRAAHPQTVAYWRALEDACAEAVMTGRRLEVAPGGAPVVFEPVPAPCGMPCLRVFLPSGRPLTYWQVKASAVAMPWHTAERPDVRPVVTFGASRRRALYGGLITENIVQAVARDVLQECRRALDPHAVQVLDVHDEIILEVAESAETSAREALAALMRTAPAWAPGLPLAAEAESGPRYAK